MLHELADMEARKGSEPRFKLTFGAQMAVFTSVANVKNVQMF